MMSCNSDWATPLVCYHLKSITSCRFPRFPLLVRRILLGVARDLLYKKWRVFFILDVRRHWCSNKICWDDHIVFNENKSDKLFSSTLFMITLSYVVYFFNETMPGRHDNTGFWLNVLRERGTSSVRIYKFFQRDHTFITSKVGNIAQAQNPNLLKFRYLQSDTTIFTGMSQSMRSKTL